MNLDTLTMHHYNLHPYIFVMTFLLNHSMHITVFQNTEPNVRVYEIGLSLPRAVICKRNIYKRMTRIVYRECLDDLAFLSGVSSVSSVKIHTFILRTDAIRFTFLILRFHFFCSHFLQFLGCTSKCN